MGISNGSSCYIHGYNVVDTVICCGIRKIIEWWRDVFQGLHGSIRITKNIFYFYSNQMDH